MDEQGQPKNNQKSVVGFLIVAGLLVVFLGFWQLNNHLKNPFIISFDNNATDLRDRIANVQASAQSRFTDTDHDGLTDYEEINVYHTSPYLADSDGDGANDGEEVRRGTNPTCPEGQVCQINNPVINTNSSNQNTNADDYFNTNSQSDLVAIIRQGLLTNGMTEEELAQIDDATLLKIYGEVSAEQTNSNSNSNQSVSLPDNVTKEQLADYNITQIKQVLLANGMSADQLAKMSDQQIMADWQDIINNL